MFVSSKIQELRGLSVETYAKEGRRARKHECVYMEAFPRDTTSMRPTADRHATHRRRHDVAEDEPIIINAIIKTRDNTED